MFVNIEAERARLRMTKSQIAKQLGITERTYSNYIHGVHAIPSKVLLDMATLFSCSTDYLLGRNIS